MRVPRVLGTLIFFGAEFGDGSRVPRVLDVPVESGAGPAILQSSRIYVHGGRSLAAVCVATNRDLNGAAT